ncbi:hypothetical protein Bb109J_c1954 [Bdellovibrio bacteriovorus]|uniref:hypothetical protein n=1 Tax=Bdellovibrio bacteriovorus TaxID=959 RepID=UPI00045C1576|nr:hypothetical protein [Bdellovibrio bacteriovorus]AHZ84644.1 hypothetical protein EP01_06795 [Bdellovibrio bacteriovorus]BEV68534.1 hypothetical protein Bb109J_c1954 [Bdellovibrio bacteriovorus]
MSLRQLQILILKIHKRKTNDFAKNANFQAALHGLKLDIPTIGIEAQSEQSPVTFNKEQIEFANQTLDEAMNRKAAEYG